MKTAGILMILGISILLSASICKYEKSKIDYCDKMVFLGSKVMVLLKLLILKQKKFLIYSIAVKNLRILI